MKIVVDIYGGDNAPEATVGGALYALEKSEGFDLVLVGKQKEIEKLLEGKTYDKNRISIVDAQDVISCNESPTEAIRTKPESSIVKSVKILREDPEAKAFVSAGSTGAVLTAAVVMTKRIKGLNRPALAPTFPTMTGGEVMLLDCGANVDCKPINLLQFAVMGSVYMREVYDIDRPRVALLSNGTEDAKGSALTKEAFALLKNAENINFVGNMEARDILFGDYDVVVADGFCGNIALKSIEGTAKCIMGSLKREIKASKMAKLGALFMKKSLYNLKNLLDYNKKGGAVLLGMENVVVKAHGSSKADAFGNAILQAYGACGIDVSEQIRVELEKLDMQKSGGVE
ncbi:MAG: phosphate acyltransferase PlsX [Clostridia bacterium]|nr:phosphate acyltransferase PlsX [Clostridia bacterium]MBR1675882.1 phosphate acyltransferase PlsX [Clostridia bacterium]